MIRRRLSRMAAPQPVAALSAPDAALDSATAATSAASVGRSAASSLPSATGTPTEGQTLTAVASSGLGTHVSRQWVRSTAATGGTVTDIAGQTGSTHVATAASSGKWIGTVDAVSFDGATRSVTSHRLGPASLLVPTLPSISGLFVIDETLTAADGDGYGVSLGTFQWQRSPNGVTLWSDIEGEDGGTYVVAAGDADQYIRVMAGWLTFTGVQQVASLAGGPVTGGA